MKEEKFHDFRCPISSTKATKIQSHRGKMRMNPGVDVEDDEKG